jgi:hypothetical protein
MPTTSTNTLWRLLLGPALALTLGGCGQAAAAQGPASARAAPTPVVAPATATAPTTPAARPTPALPTLPPADVVLGDGATITLARGEAGSPAGQPILLRFVEVLEDSRCPDGATCVWAGRVVVSVEARLGADAPQLLSLGLPGLSDDAPASRTLGGQTISIEDLAPHPALGQPDAGDAYLLTLLLRPAGEGS